MARAKKQPDGSVLVRPGVPERPAINADEQPIVAAGQKAWVDGRGLTVTDGVDERVITGDVSGKQWGNTTLPPGTYGMWGEGAGLFLRGLPKLVLAGDYEQTVNFPSLASGETGYVAKEAPYPIAIDPITVIPGSLLVGYSVITDIRVPENQNFAIRSYSCYMYAKRLSDNEIVERVFSGGETYYDWHVRLRLEIQWFLTLNPFNASVNVLSLLLETEDLSGSE